MAASDESSVALPTREELNRTLLGPPSVCRFCGFPGGDFLGLLVHSLGVHPINYILLREHVQAHGSDDGFLRLELPLPECPRVFEDAQSRASSPRPPNTEKSIPSENSSTEDPSTGLLEQVADMVISDEEEVNGAQAESDKQPTALKDSLVVVTESCLSSSPAEPLCIVSEDLGDHMGSQLRSSPKRREKKAKSTARTSLKRQSKRHPSRSPPRKSSGRRYRPSSRGRRWSPSPPPRKRRSTAGPQPVPRAGAKNNSRLGKLKALDGKKALRCEHNVEPCRLFPNCAGRHCPLRHPLCNSGNYSCLQRNDCPFDHEEYEKCCSDCREREPPPHTSLIVFHCPHWKIRPCRYGNACRKKAGSCAFVHGECNELDCTRRHLCHFEHIGNDISYMCNICMGITKYFKSGRFSN